MINRELEQCHNAMLLLLTANDRKMVVGLTVHSYRGDPARGSEESSISLPFLCKHISCFFKRHLCSDVSLTKMYI